MRVRLSITVDLYMYYNQLSRAHNTYTENGAPLYLIILDDEKLASMPSPDFLKPNTFALMHIAQTFTVTKTRLVSLVRDARTVVPLPDATAKLLRLFHGCRRCRQ